MPLTLLPATLADIPTLARIHLDAFMLVRINQALYPHGLTPAIVAATETRHRNTFLNDPTAHYLKVVDTDATTSDSSPSPKIIAFAEYHLFPTPLAEASRRDLQPKTWPSDMNLPLATLFWSHIVSARQTMAGVPHVFLSIIATDPGEGRRGAGTILMRWGCERMDEMGCQGFLEASPMGVGLYERWGFGRVGGFEVEIPAEGGGEGQEGMGEIYMHEVMVRPAGGRVEGRGESAEGEKRPGV